MQLSLPELSRSQRRRSSASRRGAQRGAALIFALLTLVALLLATLALVRSVDSSTILMGNIGFKQSATVTADQATRQALSWLTANNAALNTNVNASGYYASTQEFASDGTAQNPVDVTGQQLAGSTSRQVVDWDGNNCAAFSGGTCLNVVTPVSATTSGANTAQYVVFRLCSLAGDYSSGGYTGTCAKPLASSGVTASKRGDINYGDYDRFTSGASPYYRIVVRVLGARNTTSFTETIVHF